MSIPPKVGRKINGKSSSETLLGTAFDDTIFGAAGNDIIRGLAGDDVIRGGLGNDTLTGGPGNNIFTFEKTRAENGLDTITDLGYNRAGRDCGGSDILDFSLAITVKKMTQAAIGNYVKVTTDKVFVDLDGTGPAGWVAWANVSGLAVGDKIKVRTAGFNGFVTVGDGAAPVFAEGQTSFSYDENQSAGATVATVTGFTDDVGVTAYRFSNSGGTSGGTTTGDGWFTIGSGGAITMTGSGAASEANDYEAGSAQSRTYYVQARDAAGNWSAPVAISLNELDVQEVVPDVTAPVYGSGSSSFNYDENQSAGVTIGTVTGFTDNVGVTDYRFVDGSGNVVGSGVTTGDGWFTISSGGVITMTGSGAASEANDYEAGSGQSHSYYVQARDAAGNWSAPVAITLNEADVDDTAPVFGEDSTTFSYDENQTAGAQVGFVGGSGGFTDNVGVTEYRFSDSGGTSGGATTGDGWFTIGSGGAITMTGSGATSEANDYEAGSGQSHSYYVQARDAAGNWSAPVAITLNEADVDDTAPVFGEDSTTFSYDENQSAGAQVGFVGGSGGFTDNVGVTEYRFSDSGGTSGGATTSDGWFSIGSGGTITMTGSGAASEANDYEAGSGQSHSYYVQARDAAGNWSAPVAITLNEADVDDTAPVFGEDSTTFSYDENQTAGAQVGFVGGSGGFTDNVGVTEYRFSDSGGTSGGATTGDGWFTIGSGGAITMTGSGATSEANDYEAGSGQSHSYYVQARDAAGNWSAPVAITLNEADVDDTAPVFGEDSTTFSYDENQSAGAQVGFVGGSGGFTDNVGVTEYRFSDSGGTSGGATTSDGWFSIGSGGTITMTGSGAASEANDYEAGSGQSHSYYVQARDAAGNWSAPVAITLNEADVDDTAPVFGEDSTTFSYDENQTAGAQVGFVGGSGGFTDNVGVTEYRFSDSGGTSGGATTGDGWFTIGSGGAITMTGSGATSEANDYEAGSGQSHSYYVQARDAAGNWSAPVAITLNEADVDDTAPKVLSVGLTAEDEATYTVLNAGDKVTVTVTMDEDTVIDITGGTPRIALNIGGTAVYANYISGSGGKLLTFEYTLQAGENDADGISIDADSLDANGGTLKDAAGNDADLTHGSVAANADYIVDTTAPVATISGDPQEGASNEAGDLYLVASTETITSLNHILALADDQFNLQTSGGADVKTVLDSNGLADGDYNLYAIDLAGNVSSSSADKLVVLPDPTGGATITSAFNNAPYGEAPSTIEQWMTLLNYTREEVLTNTGVAISLQEPSAGVVGATNTVDYIVVNLGNIQGGVADYEWKIKGVAANSYSNNRATVETSDFKVVWHDETVAASGETVTVTVTGLGAYAGSNYTLDVIFP